VSQAALALLQTDDSSADDSQQSPSKRAIDLLEGKAQVAERLPVSGIEHARKALSVFAQHPFTAATGMLENAVSGVTGGVGSLVEAVTGSDPGTYSEKLAYRPRTEAGSQIAELGGEEAAKIGSVYDQVAGTGPLAQTIKERIPETIKERSPETVKEQIPETAKELIETIVEHIPVQPPVGPSQLSTAAGQVPFAMRMPQVGTGDADGAEQLLTQLAAVNQALDATNEQLQVLLVQQQQLTAALEGLGWQ